MGRIARLTLVILGFFQLSSGGLCCAGAKPTERTVGSAATAVKMHHQILFRHAEEQHVFDGYMILARAGFIVKAFAGPGIELFTVVNYEGERAAKLHLKQLKKRMDIEAIAEDIARIYASPCRHQPTPGELSCTIGEESVREKYDAHGRLVFRHFKDAHGVGLSIDYRDYREHQGRQEPSRIHLKWGHQRVEMTIVLGKVEIVEDFDRKLFRTTLEGLRKKI